MTVENLPFGGLRTTEEREFLERAGDPVSSEPGLPQIPRFVATNSPFHLANLSTAKRVVPGDSKVLPCSMFW